MIVRGLRVVMKQGAAWQEREKRSSGAAEQDCGSASITVRRGLEWLESANAKCFFLDCRIVGSRLRNAPMSWLYVVSPSVPFRCSNSSKQPKKQGIPLVWTIAAMV